MTEVPTDYHSARRQAEVARARAVARRETIAEQELAHRAHLRGQLRRHWWQLWKPVDLPGLHFPFDVLVDRHTVADPDYRVHIGDVQWFLAWASMYAQGEQRAELREISRQLSVPVRTSGRPARVDHPGTPPSQRV